jgi:tripartite-type tricarboxylate transporter receptor subunit TctC
VRFIVPFPPGGPTDILGRVVATRLAEVWAVPVVADNRPGAGGNIGTEQCARSPADGYTVCMLSIAQTISPSIYRKLAFDPVRDLAHVTLLATLPSLLVVHPSLPVRSVKELTALARARPGALSYASGGTGTSTQLLMEWLKLEAGLNIVHVPTRGPGPRSWTRSPGRSKSRSPPSSPCFLMFNRDDCARSRCRPGSGSRRCPPCRPWRKPGSGTSTVDHGRAS